MNAKPVKTIQNHRAHMTSLNSALRINVGKNPQSAIHDTCVVMFMVTFASVRVLKKRVIA